MIGWSNEPKKDFKRWQVLSFWNSCERLVVDAFSPIEANFHAANCIGSGPLLHHWLGPSSKRYKVVKGCDVVPLCIPQREWAALCVGISHDRGPLGLAGDDTDCLVEQKCLADQTFKELLVGTLGGAPSTLYIKPKGIILATRGSEVRHGALHLRLGASVEIRGLS